MQFLGSRSGCNKSTKIFREIELFLVLFCIFILLPQEKKNRERQPTGIIHFHEKKMPPLANSDRFWHTPFFRTHNLLYCPSIFCTLRKLIWSKRKP